MIHALKRGGEVEFPFGKLKRVRRHFSKLWDAIDDWPANRDLYTIVHEVDEAGDRELHPWAWPKNGASVARSRRYGGLMIRDKLRAPFPPPKFGDAG
jgi:hypothetical protein